jgi:cytidyltransferase-like protein
MGERKTCYQPKKWKYTVHVYGRCGVFGYAVEDADTLPSQLQKILKDKEIRVVSHSTWGAEDGHIIQNINEDLIDGVIDVHDIIIFYMNYLPNIDLIRNLGVYVYDSTEMFHKALMQGVVDFYDIPGHMNAEGYRVISRIIYDEICGDIDNQLFRVEQAESKKNAIRGELLDEPQKLEVSNYIEQIKSKLPAELLMNSIVGAIVMNCNPFTRGHRYLIEEALKSVGVLIIFVVQEDNSDFSFEDRYNMVKCGTSDLKNVFVFPSGRFIVSSFTLPDYVFKKTSKSVVLDMNLDVEIFARYIAPSLNISYRFVGTEPNDIVTARYNETQKNIFEKYGIHLVVIKRLEVNSAIVSASVARKLIKEGRETEIYDYLPDSSVNYLRAHGFFEGGC